MTLMLMAFLRIFFIYDLEVKIEMVLSVIQ